MTQDEFAAGLGALLQEMGQAVDGESLIKLYRHHKMVYAANDTLRLTAIEEKNSPLLNFADSLSPLAFLEKAQTICDIGSGAGFPGLALAIVKPGTSFMLLDSLKKRVGFLKDVIRELRLENVQVEHMRAEDAGRDPRYRERFDAVVARALASAPVLCEYALPLLKIGGRMIAYKGSAAKEELQAAQKALDVLGGAGAAVVPAMVPGRGHMLMTAEKVRPTPNAYPRRAGMPLKLPIA
ncbi:MAG: 16S rRNA (guanine(527)-N(7))-methyltransferase RsmG [Bacillota bacterium]